MDVIEQLEIILPKLEEIAGRVTPDQFGNSTPCAEFEVRDLFDHLIGGASQFAPQLRGDTDPAGVGPTTLSDDERPRALKAALGELLEAAKSPGALGRSVDLPFGTVPGAVLARFLTVDGMVHSWDLATATGQRFEPPEPLTREVLAIALDLIAPAMRDGDTFAAEQRVSDDAPTIDRLVAFTGRTI